MHRGSRLIDVPDEGQRTLQDRLEPLAVLDARRRIFVLDDEVGVGDVEGQQLARGELMIEPVDGSILQVGKRIVPRRSRQLVLAQHHLLLPGVQLIGRLARRLPPRGERDLPAHDHLQGRGCAAVDGGRGQDAVEGARRMSATITEPILGRVAWRNEDLAGSSDWIRTLTAAEVEELESALRAVQRRGLAWREMTKDDFLIPRLAAGLVGSEVIVGVLLLVLLLACVFAAANFLRGPRASTSKGIEVMAGIWTLGMYLSLGVLPLVLAIARRTPSVS